MPLSYNATKETYQRHFTPDGYHELLLGEEWAEWEAEYTESFTAIYELFKSGRFTGRKLLEIGSGPTVHNIASASAYFSEIVQSDFVETSCEELRKWLRGESNLDWSPMLNIIAKIEGHKDVDKGRRDIEARICKSVTSVVHCDLLRDEVLPPEATTEYDFIVTSATLESAAADYENYKLILQRVSNLLRPGGGLLIIGYLNGEDWICDGHNFKIVKLNKEQINRALDSAGFDEKEWIIFEKNPPVKTFQYDNFFNLVARKREFH